MWQVEMDGQVLEEEETACTKYDDMRVWKVHKDLQVLWLVVLELQV